MPLLQRRLLVAKLGGSLLDWSGLADALSGFVRDHEGDRLVLVVGGGAIVDSVRALDHTHGLGEERSHALALRAMDLTAHVVAALMPGFAVVEATAELAPAWLRREVPVLAPRRFLERDDRDVPDPLPRCWDLTSDSIAARVAVRLGADELLLLKSTAAPSGIDRREAAAIGLVDRHFPAIARPIPRVGLRDLRDSASGTTTLR